MVKTGRAIEWKSPGFIARKDQGGECLIEGNILYLLYQDEGDAGESFMIARYQLNDDLTDKRDADVRFGPFSGFAYRLQANVDTMLVYRDLNLLLDKNTGSVLLDESKLPCALNWGYTDVAFIHDQLYLRQVDGNNPALGFDVYDLENRSIVNHFDIMVPRAVLLGGQVIVGEGGEGEVLLWEPLSERRVCVFDQLINEQNEGADGRVRFGMSGEYVIAAKGVEVILINRQTARCTATIDLMKFRNFSEMVNATRIGISHYSAVYVSISNSFVVISGDIGVMGYVLCLRIEDGGLVFHWLYHSGSGMKAQYFGGPLVYGTEKHYPAAWSVESGAVVWRGTEPSFANLIQAGDDWVVFHPPMVEVHCYRR